jgi:hypothetical protein
LRRPFRRHVDAATLEKIVNELLDVPGNRSFRHAIETLTRELIRRVRSRVQRRSPGHAKSASRAAASLFANDGTFLLPGVRVRCRYMLLLG